MPQAQWAIFTIINYNEMSDHTLVIKKLDLSHGIFHENGHPDWEIDARRIEGTTIPFNKQQFTFSSCGSALAGTTGSFDIWIKEQDVKLCHCEWDCPYWSKHNTWMMTDHNPEWTIEDAGFSPIDALGHITISAYNKWTKSSAHE